MVLRRGWGILNQAPSTNVDGDYRGCILYLASVQSAKADGTSDTKYMRGNVFRLHSKHRAYYSNIRSCRVRHRFLMSHVIAIFHT